MKNIHASCISYNSQGILILGESGAGKSELCLRMIMNNGAILVADDRVDLEIKNEKLIASSPTSIAGLLEVHFLGIKKFEFQKNVSINLVVELVDSYNKLERMPELDFFEFENISIKKIKMSINDFSIVDKTILSL